MAHATSPPKSGSALDRAHQEYEKEQKRVEKRFERGKLYPISDIPVKVTKVPIHPDTDLTPVDY